MKDAATAPADGNLLERACGALAKLALLLMVGVIGAELVMRNVFSYSWEGTDELAGYLLVTVTYLSLATSLAHGGFHQLLLVKHRLPPRARGLLELTLQVVCLLASLLLTWYFARLVIGSWTFDERSMTGLRVPLWLPRLAMPIGTAALSLTLMLGIWRTLRSLRRPDYRSEGF